MGRFIGRGHGFFGSLFECLGSSDAPRRRRRSPLATGYRSRHGVAGLLGRSAIFQPLEQRLMLDIGGANSLPPTIVVGRTLSAYDVPAIQNSPGQNNQETLTFTVYNQAADPITGVLLTDTLANGVTLASASQLPDQNGQQLAWSLGTIQPYDRASVTLTVSLTTPTPTTLDSGASAYGTLDAGMVTWTTAPATMRTTAIATDLLASTPDANTTDPYVREEAAQLNYDPTQIYNFLQTQIDYNSYVGSLRGARGTLWSSAGNSLDDASLGVALMRASGIPAQYVSGTLSQSDAQQLILSMFPANSQTVGYIQPGTTLSNPANAPQLLSETESHDWFQFDTGNGMQDADPLMAGAQIGQSFATATTTFASVPQDLEHTTEIKLNAEITNTGAALFGLGGQQTTTVLDQTFDDVDLVGRSLSIGNFVSSTQLAAAAVAVTTNTYDPYLVVNQNDGNVAASDLIPGTSYQEVISSFGPASQILTGLFLDITTADPQQSGSTQSNTVTKAIVDRIGYVARQSGGTNPVTISPTSQPPITSQDVVTLAVSPEISVPDSTRARQLQTVTQIDQQLAASPASTTNPTGFDASTFLKTVSLSQLAIFADASAAATAFYSDSDAFLQARGSSEYVVAYTDSPRIVSVEQTVRVNQSTSAASVDVAFDILKDSARTYAAPGQATSTGAALEFEAGLIDSALEELVLGGAPGAEGGETTNLGALSIFLSAAAGSQSGFVVVDAADLQALATLSISAEAKARIAAAAQGGDILLVPTNMLVIGGNPTIAWLDLDPKTGLLVAVNEDGTHGDLTEESGVLGGEAEVDLSVDEGVAAGKRFATQALEKVQEALKAGNRQRAKELVKEAVNIINQQHALAFLSPFFGAFNTYALTFNPLGGLAPSLVDYIDHPLLPDDPPVGALHFAAGPAPSNGPASSATPIAVARNNTLNPTTGIAASLNLARTGAAGALTATWQSTSGATTLRATSGNAANATVKDAAGLPMGSGSVDFTAPIQAPAEISASGGISYSVMGVGSLSFYGPAESTLAVSGDWNNYSASLAGNVALTLSVADGELLLNGQALPAGTYTITTNAATLSGTGAMNAPTFAGTASIAATNGTLELGPASGSLSAGGTPINVANETTLTGYKGTINVAANGNGTDAVTLNGDAANVLTLAPSLEMLSTDQNTPVSFNAGVNTSFADTYNLTASAPTGWTVTIDNSGKVTVTPAPGTQSGTFPIQVIAQSTTNPDLISQSTVEVTVTSTMPGMTFAVKPDPVFTVPFDNAQVPSAYRATIQNTGPKADTYNLTFSTIPAGFALLDSGTSVTVPAGQTGILGLYLQPTGATLPAAGTQVAFTVTATSTSDPSITKTIAITFTMPTITAATVTSDPVALSTTPGAATTATITITNVGNVPFSAALATTTDSGLTISGLSSPGVIPVGQSVTETATLTPDAGTPLNSTLNATVNVDQAAAASGVSVVAVVPALRDGGASQSPQATASPSRSVGATFVAGDTVDVSADMQSEVSAAEQGTAAFTVTDGAGQTVLTSATVPVSLDTIGALATVDLGTFSTTGFAAGQYTIDVTVDDDNGNPIAGATGTTTLMIGLPVSASLSVDTDNQAPGPVTSTETLTVASNAVIGNVATDSTAQSVAVNGTLAYVANSQDISVVDISNQTRPQVLSTFGSKDINQGGFNLAQVAGGDLVVASQDLTYASQIKVLIYSLANPQSPTLVGSATVPYDTLIGMTIEGTTAYLSAVGLQYDASGLSVTDQTGELVAVDFSNPAAPTIAGSLFNDLPQPFGHDTNIWQSAAVNSQTLYVAGSTSTGTDVQTGTGRVLIVKTAGAGSMSVSSDLDLPGTVQALAVAVDGTRALVVGSNGGWISPFGDFSNVGLSGNVTLTLLDISNPASPIMIGSTVVTQNTFVAPGAYPAGALEVIDLGNGQFAINGTLSNGSPTLLLVDASNPNSLATSNLPVNVSANGLMLAGGQLFGAGADGLTIYQPAALATTPVTVSVTVPTNGVSIAPDSFSLAPTSTTSGANSKTLAWNLNLAPGQNQQITWQTNIANLQAEQVQPVVTSGTFQYTSPGATASPPRSVGATYVAGVPTPISVTIPVEVAAPGVPAINNAAVAAQNLNIPGLSQQLNDLGTALTNLVQTPTSNVYLGQATAALASLITLVTNDPFLSSYAAGLTTAQTALSAATTPAEIQTAITDLGTALDSLGQAITDYALHGFTLSLASNQALALPGAMTIYNVVLQNTGSQTTTYDFSVSGLPAGVTGTFRPTSITLAPGQSIPQGTTVVTLSLSQSASPLIGGNFTVTATAEGAPEITLSTQGQLTLLAESLTVPVVTVTPPFTQPGGQVDVTAKIQSVVNEPHTLSASFTVTDPNGNVIYTDLSAVTVAVSDTTGLSTVDLGNIDTTGFADGVDTVTVTVTDTSPSQSVPTTLPTASGTANLTIGLPVMASVTTSPNSLPENKNNVGKIVETVTNTLTVNAETPFTDPLTLDGQVQTTPTGSDVALYPSAGKTYAYVSGTNGIDIVDVTDPASPVDKGAFGVEDLVKGGITVGRIATLGGADYLIVGTSATLNANEFTLLIYSLSNPLAPAKVSKTEFDYEFMNELLVDGTTLLVPTAGLSFFAGGLDGVYGTVLSIDISNPAAPTLKGELYNSEGTPTGGDTQQIGGVVATSGLAYITSSTETTGGGFTLNPGVGRVLVVDDSNPAQLAASTEVDIPGTEQSVAIGIQGNQALVVSGTGGPAGNSSNYGQVSGNLVLSLMDISNPASPQLIGATLITGDTYGTTASNNGGAISVAPLGNGLFAVSGAIDNGKPVLLLVDPIDPNNIVVSATTLPVAGNEMAVSGNILYSTSSQGLTTYQIGSIAHTPYTASVEVPNDPNTTIVSGSFSIPPTTITTGANFTTLTWVRQLAFGQDQQTFTWQTDLQNLIGGEVRPVTLGTSVSFVSQNTPGSLSAPATSVTGIPIAQISPASQTAAPGGTLTFDLRLTNPLNETVDDFLQSIIEFNFMHTNVPAMVRMQPNSTVDVPFSITSNINDLPKTYDSFINVVGDLPPSDDSPSGGATVAPFQVILAGTPVIPTPDAHGVAINLTPTKASAGPDGIAKYTVQVTNTGSVADSFGLSISGPGAQNASFQLPSDSLFNEFEIPPGATRDATLTLAPGAFVEQPGDYPFTVTATAGRDHPPFSASTSGTLTVLGPGVYVNLTPTTSSTAPGAPYQVVVQNVGTVTDTFNLSLGGPAAQVASLAATQTITLVPGNSQRIDITTSAADFADAGNLPLTVIATSQTNPAVVGASTANLTVPATQSVTASFSPPTQNLAAPGATSFLLQVNNTGNTEDSYSATITGTNGPITASLIGLDGQPAQSVPLFIVPGLAQGAILLDVSGLTPGQDTVTVTIQSLTDSSETTTATATLNVASPVQMQLTLSANSGITPVEGSTTTIASSILEASVVGATVGATDIVYTLTSPPANGSLLLNGQALASGGTFAQDDINGGRLSYQSTEEGADSFAFSVASTNALGTTGTFSIAASDAPLTVTGGFTYTATAGAAGASQTVATFIDTGGPEALTNYAATINWGDGSSATAGALAVDANTGIFTASGAHTYASDGTFDVTVTVTHETAPAVTAISTADISATAAPVLSLVNDAPIATTEGSSVTLTNSVLETTDSDTSVSPSSILYTITAAPTLGTLADDGIQLTRGGTLSQQDIKDGVVTYHATEEGADSFAFSVAAGAAAPISGTLAITSADAPLTITGGFTYAATEGAAGTAQTVATFSDTGGTEPLSDYAATIDWGDDTSATTGVISVDPNTHIFTVSGQHSYAQDGKYMVKVTMTHEAAPTATVASTALVAKASASGGGAIAATGVPISGNEQATLTSVTVATFTDGDGSLPAGDFNAVIDWGDGVTSPGSVTLASGTYAIVGSHEYLDEGQFTIRVNVGQISNPAVSATVSAAATMHEELLAEGTLGTANQRYIDEIYRDAFNRKAERTGREVWVGLLIQGTSREAVAYDMLVHATSEEFQKDTVAALYEQYLHRSPEQAGIQSWSAYLYGGGTIEGMTLDLLSSPEYGQVRGGGTAGGFLQAVFQDTLGRAIDGPALAFFEGLISKGVSAGQVAAAILSSDEYRHVRVEAIFEQFLDRPAKPSELGTYANELAQGVRDEQIIAELIASDEYFAKAQM